MSNTLSTSTASAPLALTDIVNTPTGPMTVADLIAASKAKMASKEHANKVSRVAQQSARVILGDGLSELAKTCRRVVTASGEHAEEKIAQLVLDLAAVAESYLAK